MVAAIGRQPTMKEETTMESKQAPMAQRSQQRTYFNHKDMDFYFSWILGRQVIGGSESGECYEVASRTVDGDPKSWQQEWLKLAKRVGDQAVAALDRGDKEAARQSYLRACTYFRAPLFAVNPEDPAFREYGQKLRSCFQKAAALFDPPIETIQVPFQGKRLLGYLWKVDNSGQKRPTFIVIGGMETFAEDCYFVTGPEGSRRGYNVMTVDLPGQGINPDQGLFLEAKMGAPVTAVIDYATTRPEIDLDHLALMGFSWGGHIVLQGAQHDSRIKALVANPPMPDVFRAGIAQQGSNHGRADPFSVLVFDQMAWRMGLKLSAIFRRMIKAVDYLLYARADCRKILCPALFMAGEGEAEITLKLARASFEKLPNPCKQLSILTKEQGGEAHCQVNNLRLLNQVVFDWLDGVFRAA
jgi:pimeloyl-ACP methyl ester carboxylesterase